MTSSDFRGKVVIVTGASRGIGLAAARAFAGAGASVVLSARSRGDIERAAEEIRSAGGRALAVPTDVGDEDAVRALVARSLEAFGRLDAAFNDAGGGHMPAPLAELAAGAFDEALRANLRGTFICMAQEIPAMLRTGGGAIVNMSSTAGVSGVRGMAAYAAAKHGVLALTKSAALDYAAQGVRVNAVSPGPVATERIRSLTEEMQAPIRRAVPMARIGGPEEVVAAVLWLASDRASYVTGANLLVDGGRMAAGA